MKVLHVIPSLSTVHGGPTRAIHCISRALRGQGIDVDVATTNDDGPGRVTDWPLGMPHTIEEVNAYVFPKQLEAYKVSLPLDRWLRTSVSDYDLVHIHALFSFSSTSAGFAARRTGTPYVIRPLGVLAKYGMTHRRATLKRASLALVEGSLLRHASAVHFTSAAECAEAESLGIPMHSALIPLGVNDVAAGVAGRFNARHPLPAGGRRLLYLSRLDPKKNVESLLRALAIDTPPISSDRLVIAGDGAPEYVSSLRRLAGDLGIAARVLWLGHVEGQAKADLFAAAHLFVLPSHSENFGIAAAEALMAGLPCLLGRGVAIASEVEMAGAGIQVDPTPRAITDGLARSCDPSWAARARESARELAIGKYSEMRMGLDLAELYRRILSAQGARESRLGAGRA